MTTGQTASLTTARISGGLLAAGLLIGLLALGILALSGAMPAFAALLRGSLADLAPHVLVHRLTNILYAAAWITLLLGFVLLTRLLIRSGDELFSVLSVVAITVATVLALLEASFGFIVTPWAAEETARTGTIPVVYDVLDRWVGGMQAVYIVLGLAAQAGFGAALLKTGFLPTWVGRTTLVWSLAWLVVIGLGIPAVVFIMPALIGVALLLS